MWFPVGCVLPWLLLVTLIHLSTIIADNSQEETDSSDPDDEDSLVVEESVVVLNTDNFDDVISQKPTVLVEFYAPWCGHCKTLAPKYAAAAVELAKRDPSVTLAKVDATVHSQLAERFDVTGYPTLKLFKNGKGYDYDGPRETIGIVEYMLKVSDPNWQPEPEAVVTLTKENFAEFVESNKLTLVEFYAPWCGHCKKLAPIYEKAAKELKEADPAIPLAKVDATQESDLASRFEISGYPTLKIFRNGKATDYKGERNNPYDIIKYMKNQVGDGAKEIHNKKELKEFFSLDDITVVGFFETPEDSLLAPYQDLSNDIRDEYKFGITFNAEVRKALQLLPNSVVVFMPERFFTKFEPKRHILPLQEDTTSEDISAFLRQHRLPLVGNYAPPLASHYDQIRPLCLVFYSVDFSFDHKEATQFWRHKVADIAVKFPEIKFAVADDEDNLKVLEQFGLADSGEEINIALFGAGGKKFPMEPMDEFDEEEVVEFLKKYKKGKLKPYVKSQRPPKKQDKAVTVVVAQTFDTIVKDSSKDVLIEMYAPWCGHCKQLEPKYELLAKKLKSDPHLVIAKMDASANDVPDNYPVSGFPTIYFAASNNKESPIQYDGGREVADFEDFLKKHATVAFGKSKKEEL